MSAGHFQDQRVSRLLFFTTLGVAIMVAIPIGYYLTHSRPTGSGLLEYALLFPVAFPLLFSVPVAWPVFLPLPVMTIVLTVSGLRSNSRLKLKMAVILAFAASITNAYWIEALMGI